VKISVIVPVFNTSRFIDRCISALLEQDYPMGDYEIIAIDNDSSDDSADRLGRYPITIIRESKPGSYAARNAGMRIAQGELLAFTDSDCAPRKDWLSTIASALSDPSVLLVQGKRLPNSNSDLMQAINAYELRKDELILGGSDPRKFYGYTNNMGMRRTTWDEFGPFVERDRGADTIFVRSVVDAYSPDVVHYVEGMIIDHLELGRLRDYFKKMFIYGRSRKRYRHIKATDSLDFSDRLKVFKDVLDANKYSPLLSVLVIGSLAGCMLAWQMGSAVGTLETLLPGDP
jgi:glycosyltransferase involved in cell wall biosynthesis